MTLDVSTEIIIDHPIDKVAAYASNPDHVQEWYVNIKSVEWKTKKPLIEGSRVAFKAKFLGRTLAYTYEFSELELSRRLVMKTFEGPFPMETIYTWEAIDPQTTRMTLRNRGIPSGFSRLFAPLMASAIKRANSKDLENLKCILEDSAY
ncbi:MAG: SRPBCC family protein [Reichenbachiella sp.]|uniref:SRPBCC family protein n=1 Tax=Reichenbachiella sp. TaxID=2184521 RepID=UPI0032662809